VLEAIMSTVQVESESGRVEIMTVGAGG